MNAASFWDRLEMALGIDEAQIAETAAKAIQVLFVILLTVVIAHLLSDRFQRLLKGRHLYAEIATLIGRVATLVVYAVGMAIILGILGASWTALAAILGAATLGVSLALQDVGRSFVNGVYILIERPFRIGDQIRIGAAEGRVEDVGVRITKLKTPAGERIIVPNTLVFSSVIETTPAGTIGRQTYVIEGIGLAISEIEQTVFQALSGIASISQQAPRVNVIEASPDGTNVEITVEHDHVHGARLNDQVIDRLREAFPGARVSAKTPTGAP